MLKTDLAGTIKKTSPWLKILAAIIALPIPIAIFTIVIYFPYGIYIHGDVCRNVTCVENFFTKNFSPFTWFTSWLGIFYNLATIFGIIIAVFTYKKNSESQSMINHFSNLGLFTSYVSSEIGKLDYLHPSSFDIVMWYRCIYDQSKNGSLECSDQYSSLINQYAVLINNSNSLKTTGPSSGYSYRNHQEHVRKIVKNFGIDFQEASRTGFKEIEDQLMFLLNKVNISFVCSEKLKELPIASYK